MYIAYSALSPNKETSSVSTSENHTEILTRYEAYLATCDRYSQEIKQIQQYLPGWTPKFHY